MRKIGARELRQHTRELVEKVLAKLQGEPVAVISPVDRCTIEEAVESEARRAEQESLNWLAASESSFSFWDNPEDGVWDDVAGEPSGRAEQ